MQCPNVTSLNLQGSYFGSTNTLSTDSASFSYVVKACPEMNALRSQYNIPNITCASNEEIIAAAPQFQLLVGIARQFFSPWSYNQDGMQTEVQFSKVNSFLPNITQKKSYEIAWRKTLFRDSYIYNYPLDSVGKKITSYLVSAADYIVEPDTNAIYLGMLNYNFY